MVQELLCVLSKKDVILLYIYLKKNEPVLLINNTNGEISIIIYYLCMVFR